MILPREAKDVLDFWFGTSDDLSANSSMWFKKSDELDAEIKERFEPLLTKFKEGQLKTWQETPLGCLAHVILLDQFTRNMFRDQKVMYDFDENARELTRLAVSKSFDEELPPQQRWFLYMPMMHSEVLADQEESLKLFGKLKSADESFSGTYVYAQKHYDIVKNWGRFPHRNEILGRDSTPEEIEFLKTPGSSF